MRCQAPLRLLHRFRGAVVSVQLILACSLLHVGWMWALCGTEVLTFRLAINYTSKRTMAQAISENSSSQRNGEAVSSGTKRSGGSEFVRWHLKGFPVWTAWTALLFACSP